MEIQLRKVDTLPELEKITEIERAVWGMEAVPTHHTLTVAKNGGVILGAYEGGKMVGFLYSFPGYGKKEGVYLCSHMLGILPDYQNQGLGYLLKERQMEEAVRLGYKVIRWTYDPLQSRNAYLNIEKLGAICSDYIENCYGEMSDGLNKGLPSDRFNVEWFPVRKKIVPEGGELPELILWQLRSDGFPEVTGLREGTLFQGEDKVLAAAVPTQFPEMKERLPELAYEWRMQTRQVFTQAFANGWAVAGVKRDGPGPVQQYLLVKRDSLELEGDMVR